MASIRDPFKILPRSVAGEVRFRFCSWTNSLEMSALVAANVLGVCTIKVGRVSHGSLVPGDDRAVLGLTAKSGRRTSQTELNMFHNVVALQLLLLWLLPVQSTFPKYRAMEGSDLLKPHPFSVTDVIGAPEYRQKRFNTSSPEPISIFLPAPPVSIHETTQSQRLAARCSAKSFRLYELKHAFLI
jgi:hypothetical protein